jgi:hypothetical protein
MVTSNGKSLLDGYDVMGTRASNSKSLVGTINGY